MTPRCRFIGLVPLLLSACTSAPGQDATTGKSCSEAADPHCDNAIDQVLVPMLRAQGLPIRDASATEICQRLAIDLLDRLPTPDERRECEARSPSDRIEAFMATEEYLRNERRQWAILAGYDAYTAWAPHLVELDELARALAEERMAYPEFVGRLVVHPGFLALHYEDDWAKAVVKVAFHREARDDEVAALRPLTFAWSSIYFCSGDSYWMQTALYGKEPGEPDDDYCAAFFPVLQGCACEEYGGCRSTAFGGEMDFDVAPCIDPDDFDAPANSFRTTAAVPDGDTTCPDGTQQPECADREIDELGMALGPVTPVAELDEAARAPLAVLGATIAAQNDFWEAAADRELERWLGWWKSGFRQPEWDVPAVRQVVAEELRRTGSLRSVQRLILSSLLYEMPSAPPSAHGDVEPPPWSMGPMKFLSGEAWLDSVGIVVGETIGRCDFRFLNPEEGAALYNVDPNLVDTIPTTLGDDFRDDELSAFDEGLATAQNYQRLSHQLGGCTNVHARATASSVGIVAAQRDLAQRLCAVGRGVLPEGVDPQETSDDALDAIAKRVTRRALGGVSEEERAGLASEMRACLDAGAEVGCADAEAAGRWLCQRVLDSARFAIY